MLLRSQIKTEKFPLVVAGYRTVFCMQNIEVTSYGMQSSFYLMLKVESRFSMLKSQWEVKKMIINSPFFMKFDWVEGVDRAGAIKG